jgi:hypothetical protein
MLLTCFITSRQVPTGIAQEKQVGCLACFPMLPPGFQIQAPFSLSAFILSLFTLLAFILLITDSILIRAVTCERA